MTRKTTPYARRRASGRAPERSDGITMARMHTTRLTTGELERTLGACKAAADAMRRATGTFDDWLTLCTAVNIAEAVEDGRVIRGQREILAEARQVLNAIGERCALPGNGWHPTPCLGPEIAALLDLVAAYSRQLHELTYAEYIRATQLATARVASSGGEVFKQEDLTS